jgi:hypothetical protein
MKAEGRHLFPRTGLYLNRGRRLILGCSGGAIGFVGAWEGRIDRAGLNIQRSPGVYICIYIIVLGVAGTPDGPRGVDGLVYASGGAHAKSEYPQFNPIVMLFAHVNQCTQCWTSGRSPS